ncbi:MAG: AraC family transcriptional regulator [Paenibacillus sp.]|jgi:AraC-like DNA-binding protein|nr:AraC family transcriptional regulator [Paenibacillus sp.]
MNGKSVNRFKSIWIESSHQSGKAKCEPGWDWNTTFHDYDIWFVLSGTGLMQLNGLSYPIAPGSCFIFRQGDKVQAKQNLDDRLTVIYIHFRMEDLLIGPEAASGLDVLVPSYSEVDDVFTLETWLNQVLDTEEENEGEFIQERFNCLMKLVLMHLLDTHNSKSEPTSLSVKQKKIVRTAKQYVREHIASTIEYDNLADLTGVSSRYLNRLFKQDTGISLKEYITRARIERASHLLTQTSMSVGQVAESLGYSDIYFFSKQFKKYGGQSPSYFRSKTKPAKPVY